MYCRQALLLYDLAYGKSLSLTSWICQYVLVPSTLSLLYATIMGAQHRVHLVNIPLSGSISSGRNDFILFDILCPMILHIIPSCMRYNHIQYIAYILL